MSKEEIKKRGPIIVSEGTLLPIGFVIILLGFSAWLTNVAYTAQANTTHLQKLSSRDDAVLKELKEMNTRLSRIEGKMTNDLRNKR